MPIPEGITVARGGVGVKVSSSAPGQRVRGSDSQGNIWNITVEARQSVLDPKTIDVHNKNE